MLSHFSWDFLLPQCQLRPHGEQPIPSSDYDSDEKASSNSDSVSGPTSPIDSVTSSVTSTLVVEGGGADSQPHSFDFEQTAGMESDLAGVGMELRQEDENESDSSPSPMPAVVENNLLMQMWYFAAKATHVPHRKLDKLAQRVIIKIAKGLQDDPSSLEVVHDVVSKCHRTQAEGLLDRVLEARGKPLAPESEGAERRSSSKERKRGTSKSPTRREKPAAKKNRASADLSQLNNVELSLRQMRLSTASNRRSLNLESRAVRKTDTETTLKAGSPDFEGSDDSFQSAISDLEHQRLMRERVEEEEEREEGSEETSSASNSHDSIKAGARPAVSRASSGYASVASGGSATGGVDLRPGHGGLMRYHKTLQICMLRVLHVLYIV